MIWVKFDQNLGTFLWVHLDQNLGTFKKKEKSFVKVHFGLGTFWPIYTLTNPDPNKHLTLSPVHQ